jgi:hypothetical protein
LFAGVDYGIASNIWAEMWSIGGINGVIMFLFFFIIIALLLNQWMTRGPSAFAGILALCGMVWVFYIHRNNLQFEGDLLKRYILLFLVCWGWTVVAVKSAAGKSRGSLTGFVSPGRRRARRLEEPHL